MQIKLIPALFLFLGSYFPLALILAFQDIKENAWSRPICASFEFWNNCTLPELQNPTLSLSFLCLTGISLVFFLFALRLLEGMHDMVVEESKSIPNDLINYVFPYVVSFMGLDLSNTGKTLGFFLFLMWMFLITYRSGQILMNPILLVAGWQLYEIKATIFGNARNVRALSRLPVTPATKMQSCFVQGIYVLSKPRSP